MLHHEIDVLEFDFLFLLGYQATSLMSQSQVILWSLHIRGVVSNALIYQILLKLIVSGFLI